MKQDAPSDFPITIDANLTAKGSLQRQIFMRLKDAIESGQFPPGARLPSWRDMASQLGVSRGTVKAAYEHLSDLRLIYSAGAAGSFVRREIQCSRTTETMQLLNHPLQSFFHTFSAPPRPFQLGVPALDLFPFPLWTRLANLALAEFESEAASYPDPLGNIELRRAISSYIALSRGISADPARIIITIGFRGAMNLIINALNLPGGTAWIESPGYMFARMALELMGVHCIPVPVDAEGMAVEVAVDKHSSPDLILLTPSQQAPLGMSLAQHRRDQLLKLARDRGCWIVEDDYLGELQMEGRASPSLLSDDPDGRTIHVGTFSKSLLPDLQIGFVIMPTAIAERFRKVASLLAPAPCSFNQRIVAKFISNNHFARHLRKIKKNYRERQAALLLATRHYDVEPAGCMAIILNLPPALDDIAICQAAANREIYPVPLSTWYPPGTAPRKGLMLCFTNYINSKSFQATSHLESILRQAGL